MINFSALVLAPAVAIFGQPVVVTPTKSQPSSAPYTGRGVYRLKPVEEQIEDTGLFHQTFQHEFGIQLAAYAVAPKQGDALALPAGTVFAEGMLPNGTFEISNVVPDGQGGAMLILQKTS